MRFSLSARSVRLLCLAIFTTLSCLLWQLFPVSNHFSWAQTNTPAQTVQQGVAAYRNHDYSTAIDHWQTALSAYPDNSSLDRAIILENLARAYQQIGQPTPALSHWQSASAVYLSLQNWQSVGRNLTEQAQTYRQLGQPHQAISLLCAPLTNPSESQNESQNVSEQTDDNRCQSQSAVSIAQQAADRAGEIAALGSLGEAYRAIQQHEAALDALYAGLRLADEMTDSDSSQHQALIHNSLGNTYRELAELAYQQVTIARRSITGNEQTLLLDAREADRLALEHFTQSQAIAHQTDNTALQTKALLGQIAVYAHTGEQTQIAALKRQATELLTQLSPNQETVYLTLQLVKQRQPLAADRDNGRYLDSTSASRSLCTDIQTNASSLALLQQANALANQLENNRLKSLTQGELGHYHECLGNYDTALDWTQQARLAASSDRISALDTLYLWQWQTGRIYHRLNQTDSAIDFYTQAVDNLNRVRSEILASDRTLQFSFRDTVAPVYRELAEIQLSRVPAVTSAQALAQTSAQQISNQMSDRLASELKATNAELYSQNSGQNITSALGNIDNLQLAELQNYFGSDCIVPVTQRRLDQVLSQRPADTRDPAAQDSAALISTIIFPDKTAVVLTLPNQASQLHWINQSEPELRQTVIAFRNSLEDTANELEGYDIRQAQTLYQQIIAPFQSALSSSGIDTIVFVNDGILKNIPMAALHDGQQYLIENYQIAIAPSLQSPTVSTAPASDLRALVLGLSQNPIVNGQGLGALPAVRREVNEVIATMPASDLLLNEDFTKDNLRESLLAQSYPVLHIATHGKFETEPNKTFLVTGAKDTSTVDNTLLRLGELDRLVRAGPTSELATSSTAQSPLALIVLSACETASGDERSALGLAGVTIRAGANTALASLWSIDDESTADLITHFYQNWQAGASKADALRQAQISVMQDPRYFQHPAYWAAFMLVGDWH